jgi:hypothetical protein
MKRVKKPYTVFHSVSAVLMMIALLWLTISAPFVFECQQKIAKQHNTVKAEIPLSCNEEESANPFGNSTEEKAPTSINSFSEEYLHDNHRSDYLFLMTSQFHKCENAGVYIAFHGELLVPPPNKA